MEEETGGWKGTPLAGKVRVTIGGHLRASRARLLFLKEIHEGPPPRGRTYVL